MKKNIDSKKRLYNEPNIQLIVLDNVISLQLESDPPALPNELTYIHKKLDCFNDNPTLNLG